MPTATISEYQRRIAVCVATFYEIELAKPERIETPDRHGRVYCDSLYLATAPIDWDTGKRSLDPSTFKFDNKKYIALGGGNPHTLDGWYPA